MIFFICKDLETRSSDWLFPRLAHIVMPTSHNNELTEQIQDLLKTHLLVKKKAATSTEII